MAPQAQTSRVGFGAFEVDLRTGELHKHGHAIRLPDQAFQVLAMLLERPGELVTRDELQQKLWPANTFVDFDVGLNSAIKKLRDALDDSAEHPRFIQTLPRRGYRFIAPVDDAGAVAAGSPPQPAAAPIPPDQPQTSESPDSPAGLSRSRRARYWAGTLVTAGLLLAGGLSRDSLRPPTAEEGRLAPIRSIAVLPLENLTGDPGQDYFVDGMTDALITDLAQIKALRVISRTSAMHYKGAKKPLPEIGRELQVDAVLEGSVVRSGTTVRINAQLVHAATDRHLWARSYQRDLRDIVALQNEVALSIAEQVAVQLAPEEKTRFAGRRPVNPAAYEAYLRGRYLSDRRYPENQKSIAYYEQALQADPDYALAYAGLAESYLGQGFGIMPTVPSGLALSRGREAALRAVALDDSLVEAHAALGHVKSLDLDYAGAETEFRRALQLNPGYADAYYKYAGHLHRKGDRLGYCSNMRRSYELDPLNPSVARRVGDCLYLEGQPEKAIALLREMLTLYPNQVNTRVTLADVLAKSGNLKEAIPEYERVAELSGNHPNARLSLAWAYLASGKRDAALKILREVEKRPDAQQYAYMLGVVNAEAGRKDAALRWLDLAVQQHTGAIIHFDARLDSLRPDPRFQDLLRRFTNPVPARQ